MVVFCFHERQEHSAHFEGHDIPIPKRKDFDAVLNAVTKSVKMPMSSRVRRPKK